MNGYMRWIQESWKHHSWIGASVLFCISLFAFTYWIAAPTFTDPDSFYHIKVAQLISKKQEAIVDFPWAAFTTLSDAYVDHHFLYHVYLIPFVRFMDPIVGMKLATAVLGASTITLFYIVLRSQKVRYAFLWSILLLCTEPFAFRMGLSKAPSVGFLFFVGGFYLMLKHRYRSLALLSFFYVWSYGGFILIIGLAGLYGVLQSIDLWKQLKRRPHLRELLAPFSALIASVLGVAAGLLFHPSFPQHFRFYWEQVVQIGIVNYRDVIGVGAEWYPFPLHDLVSASLLVSSLVIVAVIAGVSTMRRQSLASKTATVLFLFFFLFTLKSHRYIEYYIPWAYLFAALVISDSGVLQKIRPALRNLYTSTTQSSFHTLVGIWMAVYLFFMVPGLLILQVKSTSQALHGGIPVTQFAGAGKWLREHSNKGDIVFHNDWDDFPMLFYQSDKNYYIVGLDPTFMYRHNEDLYWKWVNITIGKQTENVFEIVQLDFGARFVLVDHEHTGMKRLITADKRFKQVYQDEEVTLYRVPRQKDSTEGTPTATPQPE